MEDNTLSIPNYSLYRVDSANRHTGGVAMYVHNSLQIQVLKTSSINFIWSLSFKILSGYVNDTFCLVYRGHQSSNSNFIEFLQQSCEFLCSNSNFFHILGDFNYNFYDKTKSAPVLNVLKSYGLTQIMNSPTRETQNSSTIIDWLLTNKKNVNTTVLNSNNIADHNMIKINLFIKHKNSEVSQLAKIR